jgi:DNA helicase II / ATP-dependent DNA helicase PcrA
LTNLSEQFKKELESLNRGQREVVFSDPQNALVFAGPGSGKTQTVICRLGYLLAGSFFAPWNLLLLTFTKKAAEEMSNRIAHFGISVNGLIRGTFHHFGNWVLSRYVKFTDLKPNYTILDSEDQEEIVKNILNEYGYKSNKSFPKASELVELFSYTCNLYCDIGKVIAEGDNSNMKKFGEDIRKIKVLYDNYKRTYNLVDYDDLLFKTLMLLKSNEMVRQGFGW